MDDKVKELTHKHGIQSSKVKKLPIANALLNKFDGDLRDSEWME